MTAAIPRPVLYHAGELLGLVGRLREGGTVAPEELERLAFELLEAFSPEYAQHVRETYGPLWGAFEKGPTS